MLSVKYKSKEQSNLLLFSCSSLCKPTFQSKDIKL